MDRDYERKTQALHSSGRLLIDFFQCGVLQLNPNETQASQSAAAEAISELGAALAAFDGKAFE